MSSRIWIRDSIEFYLAYFKVFGNLLWHSRSSSSHSQFFPLYLRVVSFLFLHMSKENFIACLSACFIVFRSTLCTYSTRLLTHELTTADYCIVLATLGYYQQCLLSITKYCKTDFPSTRAQWNFHGSIVALNFVRFHNVERTRSTNINISFNGRVNIVF